MKYLTIYTSDRQIREDVTITLVCPAKIKTMDQAGDMADRKGDVWMNEYRNKDSFLRTIRTRGRSHNFGQVGGICKWGTHRANIPLLITPLSNSTQ